MGQRLDKNYNEKLSEDIQNINKITSSDLFYKKMGINFSFNYDHETNTVFNPKFIQVKTENEENRPKGCFWISYSEFYSFYNTLLECIPIFYEDSITRLSLEKNSTPLNEEENICCICDYKKSDVMLECCVSIH
jgi:hypothetical protein